ncbi:MAG: tetratricopeptide repeat protein [Gemmatimonadales bacterium]|nr:tetratricopeptide repeat protein [Gemmatimonadales bacterium]
MTAASETAELVSSLARRLDPDDPVQQAGLAWFAARRGDRVTAMAAARRAVGHPDAPKAARRTLELLAADRDEGFLLPHPHPAPAVGHRSGTSPLAAAVAAHREGAPAVAEACYQAAAAVPDLATHALNGMAVLHAQRGESDAADATWGQLDLVRDPLARHNAILAWWLRGDRLRAVALLESPPPDTAALHHLAGWLHADSGDLRAAHEALLSALAIEPDMARAQFALGVVAERQGDQSAALEATRRALLLSPWFQPLVWLVSPKPGEVVELPADGANGQGTTGGIALLRLGRALLEHGNVAEALAMFDQALLQNPAAPAALFHRGVVLAKLRRYAEALADWDAVGRADPEGPLGSMSRLHARSARELSALFPGR